MLLFLLCGNAGKCTGNADDILYGNDVYVWRIGGIIREMGGLYQLFQCFSAIFIQKETIAKRSSNVPLSKFMRIACGYAKKSGNDTGMSGTF